MANDAEPNTKPPEPSYTTHMAGRDARYAQIGLTDTQRDQLVYEWHNRGYSYQQIGDYLHMSKSAAKYAYDRVVGKPRIQRQSDMCRGCWRDVFRDQLNSAGLCPACSSDTKKPPPPETW